MGIARDIQSNMAGAGSSLQQKRVEKVVRSTVSEVKRRKKSYKHDLVKQYSEDWSKTREIVGPEFSDIYVVTFVVANGPDVCGDENTSCLIIMDLSVIANPPLVICTRENTMGHMRLLSNLTFCDYRLSPACISIL